MAKNASGGLTPRSRRVNANSRVSLESHLSFRICKHTPCKKTVLQMGCMLGDSNMRNISSKLTLDKRQYTRSAFDKEHMRSLGTRCTVDPQWSRSFLAATAKHDVGACVIHHPPQHERPRSQSRIQISALAAVNMLNGAPPTRDFRRQPSPTTLVTRCTLQNAEQMSFCSPMRNSQRPLPDVARNGLKGNLRLNLAKKQCNEANQEEELRGVGT